MFSKSCEYGIKAMLYVASQSLQSRRVKVGEIAGNSGSPEAFTAKLLGTMKRKKLINSQTGPVGGFYLEREQMKAIKLSQIVSAIDGDSVYNGCGLGLEQCDKSNPCPLHHQFAHIRNELKTMLENTSLFDIAEKIAAGEVSLIR